MKPALAGFALFLTGASLAAFAAVPTYKERQQAKADAAQKAAAVAATQKGDFGIVNTIKIGGDWLWQTVLVGPDGKFIYTPKGGKTTVFDAATGKQVGEILDGQDVSGIAIAPDAGRGFIANHAGNVGVFDTKTYRALGTIPLGAEPGPIIYDSMSKHIFVACQNKLIPILPTMDLAKDKPEPAIDLAGKVSSMVTDSKGMLYLGFSDREEVAVIDTRIMKQVTAWSLYSIGRPVGLSMDRLHGRLFVACRDRVVAMSASDGHILDSVGFGQWVMGTAFADGKVFAAGREGVVAIMGQNAAGKFSVEQSVLVGGLLNPPESNPKTGEIYIPQVDENGHRGTNGTFKLFVLGKK